MFRPAIPLSGLAGWSYLQVTYDRQLASFAKSPQIAADQAYLTARLSQPIKLEAFLEDRRLLRAALTALDLSGEEWKRGFIRKLLTEAADPASTFVARLNNPQYTKFAETFRPVAGTITVSADQLASLRAGFTAAAFETAVGETDNKMRLGLNYKSEIASLIGRGSSREAILYRLLGNIPVRTVLEGALGLPASMAKLPVERQAEILGERLFRQFGVRDLGQLASPEMIGKVIERFVILQGAGSAGAPGQDASILSLFSGIGSRSSENLFRSRIS